MSRGSLDFYGSAGAMTALPDHPALGRERYLNDDRLRVPAEITSVVDGREIEVHLDL